MSEYKITHKEISRLHYALTNAILELYENDMFPKVSGENEYGDNTSIKFEFPKDLIKYNEYIKQQEEHGRDVQKFIELVLVFLGIDDKYVSFGNNVELNKKWKQLKELKTKLKGEIK